MGDYLKQKWEKRLGILNPDVEIEEARRILAEKPAFEDAKIVGFSNSKLLLPFDLNLTTNRSSVPLDLAIFKMMTNCDYLVCGNSSFSLWAEYLSGPDRPNSMPARYQASSDDISTQVHTNKTEAFPVTFIAASEAMKLVDRSDNRGQRRNTMQRLRGKPGTRRRRQRPFSNESNT